MGTVKNDDALMIVKHLLKEFSGTLILDAGGLRCLAEFSQEEVNERACALVLTPHLGEMKALYPEYKVPTDAISYAEKTKAVVLLKGNSSLITNGKETLITVTGCAGMAKGGSGDVLSGIIAGLVASRSEDARLTHTVALGAYINGLSAEIASDELCEISMCASDTALNVGKAISKIIK